MKTKSIYNGLLAANSHCEFEYLLSGQELDTSEVIITGTGIMVTLSDMNQSDLLNTHISAANGYINPNKKPHRFEYKFAPGTILKGTIISTHTSSQYVNVILITK